MIEFSKYHATGNDFILIDDRKKSFPVKNSHFISQLCHRNVGIGADGVILLTPSDLGDFGFRVFNSDGLEADLCGNGLCCITAFAKEKGFLQEGFSIETKKGIVASSFLENQVVIEMPKPMLKKKGISLEGYEDIYWVYSGVDHAVVFVEDLRSIDIEKVGKKIRNHSIFSPSGVNVNFVEAKTLAVRVYEKGVEKETKSCGTGAVAVAYVLKDMHNKESVCLKYLLGNLIVSLKHPPILKGQVKKVFSGTYSFVDKKMKTR